MEEKDIMDKGSAQNLKKGFSDLIRYFLVGL